MTGIGGLLLADSGWTAAAWLLPALALTLAATILALAGGLARWRGITDPGTVTAPAMLALGLLLHQLPGRVALVIIPGPGWNSAHLRWSVLLAAALAVLALAA